jgi:formylglycine-generating enzyme required for sulfatase activity
VGEADDATVSDFRLDRYLVTVGRFRAFVGAWSGGTGYLPAGGSGKHTHLNGGKGLVLAGATSMYEPGWSPTYDAQVTPTSANLTSCQSGVSTWTDLAGGGHENLPINCVDWAEAYAFCIWDGGFLPSESEWEYAAAGGSDQREYPWGQADPGTTNQYAIYGCNYGGGGGTCATIASIAPVGAATAGAGLWTQLDLVGDLLVWNLDWYASAYDACVDCVYPTPGSLAARVVRGADFTSTGGLLYPAVRSSQPPADRERVIGFRCARVP